MTDPLTRRGVKAATERNRRAVAAETPCAPPGSVAQARGVRHRRTYEKAQTQATAASRCTVEPTRAA